ncbi:MAG: hypothetical protein P8013_09905 [Candidatus Sulfobium sp.]|jgi:hypothetical protein
MKADNFYRLKVLAGFISFLFAGGWLFFAGKLNIWLHLYAFAMIFIFLTAALLPDRVYSSRYRPMIAAIYIFGVFISAPVIYDGIILLHGIDYLGLFVANLHLIVLAFFIKASLIKDNA